MKLSSYLKLIFLSAVWGGSFIFMSAAVKSFHFAVANELRLILSTLFVGVIAAFLGQGFIKREHWSHLVIISTVGITIPSFLIFYASAHIPIAVVIICSSLAPMWGLALNAIIAKTPIPRWALFGLILGCAGIGLMIISEDPIGGAPIALPGLLAALISSFLYALNNYYVAKTETKLSSLEMSFGTFFVAALSGLPVCIFNPIAVTDAANGSLAVVILGGIGLLSVVGFQIIKDVGPVKSLLVYYLIPIFGLLWSCIFLDEIIHPQVIVGGLLVLVGLSVVAPDKATVIKQSQ